MKTFDDMIREVREHLEGGGTFTYSDADGKDFYRVSAIPGEPDCYALVVRDANGDVMGSKIAAGFGELAYIMQPMCPFYEWRAEGG